MSLTSLPPVPPVADADRYFVARPGGVPIPSIDVPFPIYGDGSDLLIKIDGAPSTNWTLISKSGQPLSTIPQPIIDGVIVFSPPLVCKRLEIIGNIRPRQLVMPSSSGIVRREYNQENGYIVSALRELYQKVNSMVDPVYLERKNNLNDVDDFEKSLNNLLPVQTGQSGKVLGTDGTNATWVTGGGGGPVTPGSITPIDLSTGGPTWDTSGNLKVTGDITTGEVITDGFIRGPNKAYIQVNGSVGFGWAISTANENADTSPWKCDILGSTYQPGTVNAKNIVVTDATSTINGLLPAQTGQSGKVLSTDGTKTVWVQNGGGGGGFTPGNYGAILVQETSPSPTAWVLNDGVVGPSKLSTGAPVWDNLGDLVVSRYVICSGGYYLGSYDNPNNFALMQINKDVGFGWAIDTNGTQVSPWKTDPAGNSYQSGAVNATKLVVSDAAGTLKGIVPPIAGQSGKVLGTDGTNISWVAGGGGGPVTPGSITPTDLSTGGPSWDNLGDLIVSRYVISNGGYYIGSYSNPNNFAFMQINKDVGFGWAIDTNGTQVSPWKTDPSGNTYQNGVVNATKLVVTDAAGTLKGIVPSIAGQSGKVLGTDGTNITWVAGGGGVTPGSITPVDLSTGGPTWDASGNLTVGTGGNGTTYSASYNHGNTTVALDSSGFYQVYSASKGANVFLQNLSTGDATIAGKLNVGSPITPANGGTGIGTIGTAGQVLTSNGSTLYWSTPGGGGSDIPSGTKMLFAQASAPTGWTQDTSASLNNRALRVVSGTGAGSGGSVPFTTAFAAQNITGSVSGGSVSGTTGAYALTINDIPGHTHGVGYDSVQITEGGSKQILPIGGSFIGQSTSTGGNGGHSHSFSGSVSGINFSGNQLNLAVQYFDVIICTKN